MVVKRENSSGFLTIQGIKYLAILDRSAFDRSIHYTFENCKNGRT